MATVNAKVEAQALYEEAKAICFDWGWEEREAETPAQRYALEGRTVYAFRHRGRRYWGELLPVVQEGFRRLHGLTVAQFEEYREMLPSIFPMEAERLRWGDRLCDLAVEARTVSGWSRCGTEAECAQGYWQ